MFWFSVLCINIKPSLNLVIIVNECFFSTSRYSLADPIVHTESPRKVIKKSNYSLWRVGYDCFDNQNSVMLCAVFQTFCYELNMQEKIFFSANSLFQDLAYWLKRL